MQSCGLHVASPAPWMTLGMRSGPQLPPPWGDLAKQGAILLLPADICHVGGRAPVQRKTQ